MRSDQRDLKHLDDVGAKGSIHGRTGFGGWGFLETETTLSYWRDINDVWRRAKSPVPPTAFVKASPWTGGLGEMLREVLVRGVQTVSLRGADRPVMVPDSKGVVRSFHARIRSVIFSQSPGRSF